MEEMVVTKELKAAMRNANGIKIKLTKEQAEITCTKDIATSDGFAGTIESRYGNFKSNLPAGYTSANFTDILHKKYRGNYAMLEMLIRPGDQLAFRCFNNSSKCLEAKELYNDTLFITILRKGKLLLSDFILDMGISPDNSARRMKR